MRRLVLYPFLFVLYAVLSPLVANLDQIDPAQAVRPLAVLLLVAALAMFVLWLCVKDWAYAGYLTFLGLVFVLVFAHVQRLVQPWMPQQASQVAFLVLLIAWAILVFGIGRWIWRRLGNQGSITPALNLILALALVVVIIQAPKELIALAQFETQEQIPAGEEVAGIDCSESPDIYYILLDAYGRSDVLQEMYGLDNEAFLRYLEQQGFYVAHRSSTNYTQTIFSLAAALNFDYIGPNPEDVSGWDYFRDQITNNRLFHVLKECGYRTVALESGFSFTEQQQVDRYMKQGRGLNAFEGMLVAGSPLEQFVNALGLNPPDYSFEAHRRRVLYSFEQLRKLPDMAGPKFIFAHIITPHPPFVFAADGKPLEPRQSYSIGDGDDYPGTWQEYRVGYPAQVQYANQQLQATIDTILRNSERPPVIILQGDHGPGSKLDWDSPENTCLWERTGILNAYYLPGDHAGELYPEISPVNSFRVVMNAYFGTHLDLLPDQTYFTSHRLERQVIDVTEKRTSRQNCAWTDEKENP